MATAPLRKIAAFNLHGIMGLLNSAAYAHAARIHTYRSATPFSDNSVANALLVALTGEPGLPEAVIDVKRIEIVQRAHLEGLVNSTLSAMDQGPIHVASVLEAAAAQRDQDLAAVQSVFRQTIETGRRIAGDLGTVIRGCAAVQLGSTVVSPSRPWG